MIKIPRTIFEGQKRAKPVTGKSRLEFSLYGFFPANATSKLGIHSVGVISSYPAGPVRVEATQSYRWYDRDADDGVVVESYGLFNGIISGTGGLLIGSSGGVFLEPIHIITEPSRLGVRSFADIYVDANKRNWVKWSNIGSLDFTIGKDNIAGERPLDWKGLIYAVKKIADTVGNNLSITSKLVAYGENGVSVLMPNNNAYGLNTIYRIGLKGKNAVCGTDTTHFFVDKMGQLWKLEQTLEKLDYSEYLSAMSSSLVMLFDELNSLLYICDGEIGYVYNILLGSLGRCQPNITGIASQSGIYYVAASETINTPPFSLCTDIYDFGTRSLKTINSLEVGIGTDLQAPLYAAIDYKKNINELFSVTPWVNFQDRGLVIIPAFGREFRFRIKTNNYEWFTLDYLKINGIIHK